MSTTLENYNFLIVGIARNCAKSINNEIDIINNAFASAKKLNWLIIESDSNDNTVTKLELLKKKYNLRYESLGSLTKLYPLRTNRLAFCRNIYVNQILHNDLYKNIDYVVVADLDGVNTLLTPESVHSCWSLNIEWDACFANQSGPYYDIWALRHDLWCPNDCFDQEKFLYKLGLDNFWARYVSRFSKMVKINKNNQPIKVRSAFGGLGIYKKKLFADNVYVGVNEEGKEICEHVTFHLKRLKNRQLYIVPSLINCKSNSHSRANSFISKILLFLSSRFFSFSQLKKIEKFLKKIITKTIY